MTTVLLPVRQAAKLAGVPESTVYLWISEQRMTAVKPEPRQGRNRRGFRVDPVEVQELAELRRAGRLPKVDP